MGWCSTQTALGLFRRRNGVKRCVLLRVKAGSLREFLQQGQAHELFGLFGPETEFSTLIFKLFKNRVGGKFFEIFSPVFPTCTHQDASMSYRLSNLIVWPILYESLKSLVSFKKITRP